MLYGSYPTETDFEKLKKLTQDLLLENNLDINLFSDIILLQLCNTSEAVLLPVCSVVGGFLSQEIIKVVSRVGCPMFNVFIFSAEDCIGRAFSTVVAQS